MIRTALVRWYASFGSFGVPQAAAPIAFALIALPLTGSADDGAAMILAMTLAQLIGAVPLARLARYWGNAVRYLKLLILIRSAALGTIAVLAATKAPFVWLVFAAALAGLVNGAAYGLHRSVLNHLVAAGRLPRALGIAATINELVFVSAPVLASVLGAVSPVFAIAVLALLGSGPLLLLPSVAQDAAPGPSSANGGKTITPSILLWLLCAAATTSAVGAIEIGAVAMAVGFGFDPTLGFIFPVALCIASVAGGVWVSIRNRRPPRRTVIVYLALSTLGAVLIAWSHSVPVTMLAAVIVGFLLPPLATHYQLVLDGLAPPQRRAEVFALLRNANSIGIIIISTTLTIWSLPAALITSAVLILIATAAVLTVHLRAVARGN